MLIKFHVENFLSIKDRVELSLVPTSIKELEENILFENRTQLLKSAVIYGANASGKSNVLKALIFMKKFILRSSKDTQVNESIDIDNFQLSTRTIYKPSLFQMDFICEGIKYRYGFIVDKTRVHEEWLYYTKINKEYLYFFRKDNEFDINEKFKEGIGLQGKTRSNSLFLSVIAQFNGSIATSLIKWFQDFKYITDTNKQFHQNYTASLLEKQEFKNLLLKYLTNADLGFSDLSAEKINLDGIPKHLKEMILGEIKGDTLITTKHLQFDENGHPVRSVYFNLNKNESLGTQKYFSMAGLILETLINGKVIIIDEMDSRLHPLLSMSIVKLFNSKINNPKNAQLIFVTHDTNMLNKKLFRRDQILLAKKDMYGATTLTSLAGMKARNDEAYARNYLAGEYEAVPNISGQLNLFGNVLN